MTVHQRLVTTAILLMASSSCAGSSSHSTSPAPEAGERPPHTTAVPPARSLPPHDAPDPYLWLEEVEGERALSWVEERSTRAVSEIEASPHYQPIFERTRAILDSRDRIAQPSILGNRIYNFWQDADNPRGIWRRTGWESYLSGEPDWETVLDIDRLAEEEGVAWSFGGASCLSPDYRLCLVRLSRGGSDAVEVREFDTEALRFVEDGFRLPEAKQSVTWVDRDAVLVASDFGDGSMTTSGYARTARLWRRGSALADAPTLFTAPAEDVGVWVGSWVMGEERVNFVLHRPGFFETAVHVLQGDSLTRLELPLDADVERVGDRLVVYLRSPWEVSGSSFPAGALVHTAYDRFQSGHREFSLLLETGERQTIAAIATTRGQLLVNMLDEVSGALLRYRFDEATESWTHERVPAPEMGSIQVTAISPLDDRYFFSYSGFTQPSTLYLDDGSGNVREVRRMPDMFDAAGQTVEQHHATSSDGTRIPYFVVRPHGAPRDGTAPTLLYAYGGFEVSMTPSYSPVTGAAWLERGGTYVLANIRGGGEFGPGWHRSALLANRQRAYDDFLAVAEDLVARGITAPERLGIMGGSNGGLLTGVALTQRPELFGAVVIQVALLDMRRYHRLLAGASWMAEYGDPDDPEQWAFIGRYSPYQNVSAESSYPRVLLTTTTRDDRVHPGHARKMAARLEEMGHPVLYFENTEGGHGAGVTSEQRARMQAITFTYLWEQLGGEPD